MSDKIKAAILASLAADSLCLGAHWEYDARKIAKTLGRVETLLPADPDSYHAGKKAGDFTHYGDQTLVLLESVAAGPGFDLDDFFKRWQELFADYSGYHDSASKDTLANIKAGAGPDKCGSSSTDFSAVGRIAPLLLAHGDDEKAFVAAAKAQTKMTHNNEVVIAAAEFMARVTMAVLAGADPVEALKVKAGLDRFELTPIPDWVEAGIESTRRKTRTAVALFGKACSIELGFPGTVHLIAKYPDNYREAMIECVMAGGDSSARAMPAAMVLGAGLGLEAIPLEWIEGLTARDRIKELIDQ